jgi:RNA polymerase sigma factor (sigma-70 family)
MSSTGSVSAWIGQLQAGQESALAKLHERYWPYLVAIARKRLKGAPASAADEEDVAQEAFWSFYRRLRTGHKLQLESRHDLLALLTHIVACKAVNQIQHECGVQKRGGGRVRDSSPLETLSLGETPDDGGGTPLEQAALKDCYRHYLDGLPESLRKFAELYLAGYTHKEIAQRVGCVERTVDRKLPMILEKWRTLAAEQLDQEPERLFGQAPAN